MFRIEAATNNVKIGSNAGNYGQLSIKNEKAGSQERGLYIELSPASGTSPNNVAVFAATNSNMTQPLVRIHHESPTANQLLIQATTTGSNTVKFSVDEDGDIYTAGGVYLGGTGSANLLDDYEEGTWTATITTDGTDFTTSGRGTDGYYTKIGNIVIANFSVSINSPTNGTGNLILTGLPFTNTDQFAITSAIAWGRVDLVGSFAPFGQTNGTTIDFYYPVDGATASRVLASHLNGNITPYLSGVVTYKTT